MPSRKETAKAQVQQFIDDAQQLASFLAKNDSFQEVISDLAVTEIEQPAEFDKAMADPKGFLGSRNVSLPPNAKVQFTKNSPFSVRVCVNESCVSISVTIE